MLGGDSYRLEIILSSREVAAIGSKSLLKRKVAAIGSKSLEMSRIIGVAFLGESIIAVRRIARFYYKQPEAHNSQFSSYFMAIVATFLKNSDFVAIVATLKNEWFRWAD
jgi:hypothetical protein